MPYKVRANAMGRACISRPGESRLQYSPAAWSSGRQTLSLKGVQMAQTQSKVLKVPRTHTAQACLPRGLE